MNPKRIILHIDMDAFFAAVEMRENPQLADKPVVIGADPKAGHGRGVVSTCSYSARKFGIRSGMPISIAWRKCPQCIYLPVNMRLYSDVSDKIMEIVKRYADAFEHGGIDECYLDISKRAKDYNQATEIANKIKAEILEKEHLSCSVGIGPNKLIAKIASDFQKPNGLTIVGPTAVSSFLRKLDVRKLRGVGPKSEAALNEHDIKTIGQLKQVPKFALIEWFGQSYGTYLYQSSHGIDESPLIEHWEAKSISREWTFEQDTLDKQLIFKTLDDSAQGVHEQFKNEFKLFKTVTIKVRFQNFETHTSQRTLKEPTDKVETIIECAKELITPYFEHNRKIRLIGVRVSHLEK